MDSRGTSELVAVLTRRTEVLRTLSGEPLRKFELTRRLDVSQSTVDRAMRELESLDLVEREGNEYRLTTVGVLALDEFDRLTARLSGLTASQEALTVLPASVFLPPAFFDDPTVALSEPPANDQPSRELERLMVESDVHRVLAPAFRPRHVEAQYSTLVDGDVTVELVAPADIVSRVIADYADRLEAALSTGRFTIREATLDIPFTLVVSENDDRTEVGVLVYGESSVRGFVSNTNAETVEWGRSYFESVWESAGPLSIDAT